MEEEKKNVEESNDLKFDVLKIDSFIKKEKPYKEGENIFEFCNEYNAENSEQDPKTDYPKYFARIKNSSFEYLGILSKNLKKENYGLNVFDNGDEYFGQWNKDKKEGYGIYYFKEEKPKTITNLYIGEFKNNVKKGEGIYFNITKFENEKPLNFTLVIGNYNEDNFEKGIIYSIEDGKKKLYKGMMNKEGKREDENAEVYEDDNKIFFGKIQNNNMMEGRIIIVKDKKKESSYYFTKKGNNNLDEDIDFDYSKGENEDDKYIKKLDELENTFDNEKIKEIYSYAIQIREKVKSPNNFEEIKKINYDNDVKQKLKNLYGKFLYW